MTSLSDMTTATNMMSKKNYLSRPLMLKYPNLSLNMIKAERDIFENDVVTASLNINELRSCCKYSAEECLNHKLYFS